MEADLREHAGGASQAPPAAERGSRLGRIAPALGLFLLAPLTAEYLAGYDTSTGDLGALLIGLLFFAPLYGGPALLIREAARRSGRGWPAMLLLASAFGVFQAGLVDHSLFNPSYRSIDSWQAEFTATLIPALGISADMALNFILGHVIWSISVPIAIVETLAADRRTTPWLGWPGLTLTAILHLLASALIAQAHMQEEQFAPSAAQLCGAGLVVAALICAAFLTGRRPRPPVQGSTPGPWQVGLLAFGALSLPMIIEVLFALLAIAPAFASGWWGASLSVALLAGLAIAVARWSRRAGWGAAQQLGLAGGALLTNVWIAFLAQPLGEVPLAAKLAHNLGFALGALALLALAARRLPSTEGTQ